MSVLIFNKTVLLFGCNVILFTCSANEILHHDIPEHLMSMWSLPIHRELFRALFVNDRDVLKSLPLHIRTYQGHTLLIELASSVANIVDVNERLVMIRRLVEHGADIDDQSIQGNTALMVALDNDIQVALELASLGANPYKVNKQGKTAYRLLQALLKDTHGLGSDVVTRLNQLQHLSQKHKIL